MPDYRVSFFNTIANDHGHESKVVQRTVHVCSAASEECAIRTAQDLFARMEGVPDWHLRAHLIEAELLAPSSGG